MLPNGITDPLAEIAPAIPVDKSVPPPHPGDDLNLKMMDVESSPAATDNLKLRKRNHLQLQLRKQVMILKLQLKNVKQQLNLKEKMLTSKIKVKKK